MQSDQVGCLTKTGDRFEFSFEELGLTVKGSHPEWVLAAAAEIITDVEKLRLDGRIEELTVLSEMGEVDELDVDDLRFAVDDRFSSLPQCLVCLGSVDYRWISPEGRTADVHRKPRVERIHTASK